MHEKVRSSNSSTVATKRSKVRALGSLAIAGGLLAITLVGIFVTSNLDHKESVHSLGADGFEFLLKDGTSATLEDFMDKPLLVNFYVSTCAPCKGELPEFQKLNDARDDLNILAINHDFNEQTWRALDEEVDIDFTTGFQPQQGIYTAIAATGMPTTMFVSPDGTIERTHTGPLDFDAMTLISETVFNGIKGEK